MMITLKKISIWSSNLLTLLFFIVLLVPNAQLLFIDHQKRDLTQCSGSYHITNITFSPNPIPLYLSSFNASLSGTTDVAITGGTIVASVYGVSQTLQICSYVMCPIPVGPFTFSGTINVPSNVSSSCFALQFTGVNVEVRAYDASG
ncbi:14795_t:CDS:2, partial [Cetraspora pellucida]